MTEEVLRQAEARADPDAIWAIAREFCDPWHPFIAGMRAEEGGAVRAFTVRGEAGGYRERLTYFSDHDRVLAYAHEAGIAGCVAYRARFSVEPGPDGGSILTWRAEIEAESPARAAEIAAGTAVVFDAGLAALADQAELADLILPGEPRLALSATPEKEGPLCLFLHGIGGGRENWRGQLQAAGGVMRAAALDLRGYGGSALGPAQTTVDAYCEDILRVQAHFKAEKLVLCGLSYGAWLAASFAMRHPDRLAGLILSGGCTGMSEAPPDERERLLQTRKAPLDAGKTPADFAPAVVDVIAGPQAGPTVREALRASMAAIPAETYRDALTCFTHPPERFDFSKLSLPVLLITGEFDRLAPPAEIRAVAERIHAQAARPDVRFEALAGAGHVCNLEKPKAYNRLLMDFLRRIKGA